MKNTRFVFMIFQNLKMIPHVSKHQLKFFLPLPIRIKVLESSSMLDFNRNS